MPSAHKVGWAQLRVGVMAVVAMVIFAALIFLMTGTKKIFTRDVPLYTYMDDSAALGQGAPVRLNGILVGKVDSITLTGETTPRRIVKITMAVEKNMLNQIPVDSVTSISAENVLGTKFINIAKGKSPVHVQPNAEIQSLDVAEFQEVVQQGYSVLSSLQGIVKRVDAIVALMEVGKGSIGKLLVDEELYNRLIAIVNEFQKVAATMNSTKGTLGRLLNDETLYNDLHRSLGRVDTMLIDLQEGKGTAGKLLKDDALYQETRRSVAELRKTIEDLNAGKGTAGKLLKDEALYNDVRKSLAKVDLMLDKVNAGQGTLGQLMVNPQLYDNMNGATRELQSLFKDIRANPAKFLRIKLALF